jgi:hypothetical protein
VASRRDVAVCGFSFFKLLIEEGRIAMESAGKYGVRLIDQVFEVLAAVIDACVAW